MFNPETFSTCSQHVNFTVINFPRVPCMYPLFTWADTAHMLGWVKHMYEPQKWIPNNFLHVANMLYLHLLIREDFAHACIFFVHDGISHNHQNTWDWLDQDLCSAESRIARNSAARSKRMCRIAVKENRGKSIQHRHPNRILSMLTATLQSHASIHPILNRSILDSESPLQCH